MGDSKTGKKTSLVSRFPVIRVKSILFEGGYDIWYARIPDHKTTYVKAPTGTVHTHLTPIEKRPKGRDPHWREESGKTVLEFSWPVAYSCAGTAGIPDPKLKASFEADFKYNGKAIIKASSTSKAYVKEKEVQFTNGKADNINFDLEGLPDTVKWLSGIELKWRYKPLPRSKKFYEMNHSQHTFFIVGGKAEKGNLTISHNDKFLFEIFDWGCRWANGYKGHKKILKAIWKKFSPVRKNHDTKFVYWKNHHLGLDSAHDIVTAVQNQDHPNPQIQFAAACDAFDRILINCLAIHGIKSSEIVVIPYPQNFTRGATNYFCNSWKAKSVIGQGNKNSPDGWGNHWIADVIEHDGSWNIYDPSYGVGPINAAAPTMGSTLNVLSYEPHAVTSFPCEDTASGAEIFLKPDSSAMIPPHLIGVVNWTNK